MATQKNRENFEAESGTSEDLGIISKGPEESKKRKIMAQTISNFGENMNLWACRISGKKSANSESIKRNHLDI